MTQKKLDVVIDRSKWRTGADGEFATGKGKTSLLNDEGFMCCLGFVCKAAGVPDDNILSISLPSATRDLSIYESDIPNELLPTSKRNQDAKPCEYLASDAVSINDNYNTLAEEKERKLLELFKDSSINISFEGEYTMR